MKMPGVQATSRHGPCCGSGAPPEPARIHADDDDYVGSSPTAANNSTAARSCFLAWPRARPLQRRINPRAADLLLSLASLSSCRPDPAFTPALISSSGSCRPSPAVSAPTSVRVARLSLQTPSARHLLCRVLGPCDLLPVSAPPHTSSAPNTMSEITAASLPGLLEHDNRVKLAGLDVDGILRGKIVSKRKFLSIAEAGFGFCSVIFGWDMHDQTYLRELKVSNAENGYRDMLAIPDLSSYRRIPWENNVPFFLVSFFDPETRDPIAACPRGLLRSQVKKLEALGYGAMAGAEYEFYTFKTPSSDEASPAAFLQRNPPSQLPSLTEGMFGYSLTRPVHNKDWYYDVYDTCANFSCDIEGWHTESGPGVYEAALEFGEVAQMADRASLFKYVVKSVGANHGITPCFMAKPKQGLPGNSGHMHISLVDKSGKNLLARETMDESAEWKDIAGLSDMGRHFLAGLLEGLPDIMPILAPTINSYKRLVENFWAPVTVSWGFEHRAASIRIISPPTSKAGATRFEVRVPGADTNPHFVLAAILGCGWRGVERKLAIPCPPLAMGQGVGGKEDMGERLAKSLREATDRFKHEGSIAREVFGDDFVDHFGGTRENEVRLWDEAVTDWEMKRYIETV
ncbi:Glutamine synthetase [Purpureocillium takamizusanense]|uniref:Glutamine synthetase n=1 Tax=Purpureocillium takamizusanense TaxID=2060973 RepID=A0A9Q8V695_9HYPO|nr:Glutamine synthetase [Purpureocillium takamizusanense]UNI13577.1 Glutamine synthetase [Purpureocillium takamizusanense]